MNYSYGRPPRGDDTKRLVKKLLEEAREAGGVPETLTIDWRGQPAHVEVVNVPLNATFYNPNTHRIRAQRSFDPARDLLLTGDPWSEASQEYLHYLLQAMPKAPAERDPRFDELKESLHEYGQNNPGLITRDGIVVDANTRRAALLELGKTHIRVGVLPESCEWEDINAIELALQLRKEHRRDYSYINDLLALEEQLNLGRPIQDVAREFRRRPESCERDLWVLGTLRGLIQRSREEKFSLRLLDFEDHKGSLEELHRRYIKESASSKESAEIMKENRLAAILLRFSKTDVRLIEPDFTTRYLNKQLPGWIRDKLHGDATASASVPIPGLGRSVRATSTPLENAKILTNTILKAKAVEAAGDQAIPEQASRATRIISELDRAFENALEPAGKDARIRKRKQAAQDRISDACKDLEQCITDLVLARASRSLDEEAFDEAVLQLREVLEKLAAESSRSIAAPGEGLSWLLDAARKEEG